MIDKHSIKYRALVAYMKQSIHSTSFAKLKPFLLKKGWPEDWVEQAHEDILKKTFSDSSDGTLAKGAELLNLVKKDLPKRSSLLSKRKEILKKQHKKTNSHKGVSSHKGRSKKRTVNKSSFLSGNLHFHFDDDQDEDYAERLLRRNKNERHFYSKSNVSSSGYSKNSSSDATKENFDALKEAIKLAQSVIKSQGNIPITVKTSPYQTSPALPSQVQAQSPITQAVASAQTVSPETIAKSDSAIESEEKKILEEERAALRREREQLLEERKRLSEQSAPKRTPKKRDSHIEVEEHKGDDHAKYLEGKMQLLEERLKSVDYSELNKDKELKNEYELEEVEFTKEPVGDRAQTGIIGLDPIIQGGLRRLSSTVVAGGPGSGKTIFAMAYLINGIKQFNENGVFITFEQSKQELYDLFSNFGWDLEQLEKEKKLSILRFTPEQIAKIIESGGGSLRDSVDAVHGRRIVVDSISDLLMLYPGDMSKRRACVDLFEMFQKLKTTTLVVAEQEVNPLKHISNVLEYQVDGVILLYNERVGDVRQRAVEIFKMRGTKHAGRIFPLRITDQGIQINSNAAIKQ